MHVYIRRLLEVDQHLEIGGLVVEGGYRRSKVGRLLMEQAEDRSFLEVPERGFSWYNGIASWSGSQHPVEGKERI